MILQRRQPQSVEDIVPSTSFGFVGVTYTELPVKIDSAKLMHQLEDDTALVDHLSLDDLDTSWLVGKVYCIHALMCARSCMCFSVLFINAIYTHENEESFNIDKINTPFQQYPT